MQDILLIDGYNIIGSWPDLQKEKNRSLEEARDLLINKMIEYQARSGYKIIIVFDAYHVQGIEKKSNQSNIEVIYTKKSQTADEKIEQLVKKLNNPNIKIYVATSDYIEQFSIFTHGALRKSARELLIDYEKTKKGITTNIKKINEQKPSNRSLFLKEDILQKFEKIRRRK